MAKDRKLTTACSDSYTPPPWGTNVEDVIQTAKSLGYNIEAWPEDDNAKERIYLQFSDPNGDANVQITPDDDYMTAVTKLLQFMYDCTDMVKQERAMDQAVADLDARAKEIGCVCERFNHKIMYQRKRPFYNLGNFLFPDMSHHYNRFFFKPDKISQLILAIEHDEEIYRAHSPQT